MDSASSKKSRKIIVGFLLFAVVFSNTLFLSPRTASSNGLFGGVAGSLKPKPVIIVADGPRKFNVALDAIAYAIAKRLVADVTRSIVNWINSGFEGDPTFVSNPGDFLLGVANETTGLFIQELGLSGICDPYKPQILIALAQTNNFQQRSQCTLLDAVDNIDAFLGDFSQGGWEGWIQLTQNPQNNIYGSYLISVDERSRRIAQAVGLAQKELDQNQGFFSLKRCKKGAEPLVDSDGSGIGYTPKEVADAEKTIAETSGKLNCAREDQEVVSPGTVIKDQLSLVLGTNVRQGELADSIGESVALIFDALINQLITTGIRSLSSSGEDGADNWYAQGLANDKADIAERIDLAIAAREIRLGLNENINEGLAVAAELKACYSEQIAVISDRTFNPPNNQVVPTKEELSKKIELVKEKEKKAEDFVSEKAKEKVLQELAELNAIKEALGEAETLSQVAEIEKELSGIVLGDEENIEKEFEEQQIVKNLEDELLAAGDELEQCGADLEKLKESLGAEIPPTEVIIIEDRTSGQ